MMNLRCAAHESALSLLFAEFFVSFIPWPIQPCESDFLIFIIVKLYIMFVCFITICKKSSTRQEKVENIRSNIYDNLRSWNLTKVFEPSAK